METAKLVLEYLTLFLSWPVVLGLLVVYFLKRHGPAVNSILTRVNSLSFPGGMTLGTTAVYPPEPTSQADSGVRSSPKTSEPIEALDNDFSSFLWVGLEVNRLSIRVEIGRLWNQLVSGPSPSAILIGSEPETESEKLRAMKEKFKIDERAIEDFDFIDAMTKDAPRSILLKAHKKAQLLKTYLSKLSPNYWKT